MKSKKERALLAKRKKKEKLQKAVECFRSGLARYRTAASREEYEEAADLYTVAISLRPDNARYFFARGNAFKAMAEYQRAFFDFSSAIRLEAAAVYFCNRGMTLRKLGRLRESLLDYDRAIDLDRDNGNYYFNRALVYYEMEQYEDAVRDYGVAIADKKHTFRALYNRGNCYRRLGDLEASLADLQAACSMEEKNASAHNNLGLSFFEAGKYMNAVECFSTALEFDPFCAAFYNNRGLAQYQLNLMIECLADFEDAIKLDGQEPNYYFNRGNGKLARGEHEEAAADFSMAIKLDPACAKYLHSMGLAYQCKATRAWRSNARCGQGSGGDAKALQWFNKALAIDPSHVPSMYHAGLMSHRLGRCSDAVEALTAVLSLVRHDKLVYESRGLVFQDLRDHESAIEDFTKAIELDAACADIYYYRGVSLTSLRRHRDAIRDFNTALELGWQAPVVYNARGMAQRALGNRAEALDDLTVAVALDRDESEDAAVAAANSVQRRDRRIARSEKKLRAAAHARAAGCVADVGGVGNSSAMHEVLAKPGVVAVAVERNTKFLFNRALLFGDLGDFELAEEDLTTSLLISPHDAKILYHRGRVRFALRAFHEAAEDFCKALTHLPQPDQAADLHYFLGLSRACSGDHCGAIPCFHRALAGAISATGASARKVITATSIGQRRVEDNVITYTHELAKSQQLVGQYEGAIANFSKVIEKDPRNARAYFRRAFAYKSLLDYDRAAADFQRASEIEPTNPDLIVNYRNLHETDVVVLCDPGKYGSYYANTACHSYTPCCRTHCDEVLSTLR